MTCALYNTDAHRRLVKHPDAHPPVLGGYYLLLLIELELLIACFGCVCARADLPNALRAALPCSHRTQWRCLEAKPFAKRCHTSVVRNPQSPRTLYSADLTREAGQTCMLASFAFSVR